MNTSGEIFSSNVEQDSHMEFSRSIMKGVEIKRCRNIAHSYKSHVHNELSLGYIAEGSTDLSYNDNNILYEAGDGVIIPPLMTHRCAPKDINQWAYVMLFVDPTYYQDAVHFSFARKLTGDQAQRLIEFVKQLLIEKTPEALENILVELLIEFEDYDSSDTTTTDTSDIVKSIHDYILSHVKDVISLDNLEELSGLNKYSIIRNFKRLYTTTPAAYHLQYRVAEAKRLLSNGVEVFDICEELRFYDQAHLIREFKKMYGITPVTYIEQIKSKCYGC